MTPHEFLTKWRANELKERSASQSHFNDLCALLDLPDPVSADPTGDWFTFEKGASKTSGGEGWADVWRKGHFAWNIRAGTPISTRPTPSCCNMPSRSKTRRC